MMKELRHLAILGSTGSIGTQALSVAQLHPDRFQITALVAGRNKEALFEQVRKFRPLLAGLATPIPREELPQDVRFCQWVFGPDAITVAAAQPEADDVLVSVVGMCGLPSVLTALRHGKRVLLANKEALVAGGGLVMREAAQGRLLPVDSEHSAIFQCLQGAGENKARGLYLTCSGGPFRTWEKEKIDAATREQALKHPNWVMGQKITIDSATLFNKALEIMEAKWLFGMPQERIRVVVHPQSVVHSAVLFDDGAVLAQLGTPDMRVPILYAMAYPDRLTTGAPDLDLFSLGGLTFEHPDETRFPALRLARECLHAGGAACCVLNAANEVAVARFLQGGAPLRMIWETVEETLQTLGNLSAGTLDEVFAADARARETAGALLKRRG